MDVSAHAAVKLEQVQQSARLFATLVRQAPFQDGPISLDTDVEIDQEDLSASDSDGIPSRQPGRDDLGDSSRVHVSPEANRQPDSIAADPPRDTATSAHEADANHLADE